MFYLKSDEHLLKIGKELYQDSIFSDIKFVTDGATFHAHSSLVLSNLPGLADLLCDNCKYGHQDIVIFLPSVHTSSMQLALEEFYVKGDPTKLGVVLNVIDVDIEQNTPDKSENITDDGTDFEFNCAVGNVTDKTSDEEISERGKVLEDEGHLLSTATQEQLKESKHDYSDEDTLKSFADDKSIKQKEDEEEDDKTETMETLMTKAFQGQQLLGNETKTVESIEDQEQEAENYDDDDDVEVNNDPGNMMKIGLLNMALNSGLEVVDEVDEEKSDSAMASTRDDDQDVVTIHSPEHQDNEDHFDIVADKKPVATTQNQDTVEENEVTKTDSEGDDLSQGEEAKANTKSSEKVGRAETGDLKDLKDNVNSLKNDFRSMKKDVSDIKEDVGAIKKDVKVMNKNIKTDLKVIKDSFLGFREGTVASSVVETASEIDALIEGRAMGRDITVSLIFRQFCANLTHSSGHWSEGWTRLRTKWLS